MKETLDDGQVRLLIRSLEVLIRSLEVSLARYRELLPKLNADSSEHALTEWSYIDAQMEECEYLLGRITPSSKVTIE